MGPLADDIRAVVQHGVCAAAVFFHAAHLIPEVLVDGVEVGERSQAQEIGAGMRQGDLQRIFAQGLYAQAAGVARAVDHLLCALDVARPGAAVRGARLRREELRPGKHEVVGRNLLAVGPYCIVAQMEGIDSAVVRHVPRLGHAGDGLAVLVQAGQALHGVAHNGNGHRVRSGNAVHIAGLGSSVIGDCLRVGGARVQAVGGHCAGGGRLRGGRASSRRAGRRRRRPSAGGQAQCQSQGQHKCKCFFHLLFSPFCNFSPVYHSFQHDTTGESMNFIIINYETKINCSL